MAPFRVEMHMALGVGVSVLRAQIETSHVVGTLVGMPRVYSKVPLALVRTHTEVSAYPCTRR